MYGTQEIFGVQKLLSCTRTIFMYKNYFHVQELLSCTRTIFMYKNYLHVQELFGVIISRFQQENCCLRLSLNFPWQSRVLYDI